MMNITTNVLVSHLILFGLVELAEEVKNAVYVDIRDFSHFTITNEAGYGDELIIEGDDNTTAVYGRLVEPEGGMVWMFRDNPDYEVEVPEQAKKLIGYTSNWTPVFSDASAHVHRMDLTQEAIGMMNIPFAPADPTDRSQTRHCEVLDFGRPIGANHRTELKPGMSTFYMVRDKHDYPSLMTVDATPTPETRLTNVCFWDANNSVWVYYTNHEGVEDPWPEPGTVRFQRLSEEDQKKAAAWHAANPLICTPKEIEKAKAEGLIQKKWYFTYGENDLPLGPCCQPWAKWEQQSKPFNTKEEAKKAFDECTKKCDKDYFVTPVYGKYEKTWLDKAVYDLMAWKNTKESREKYIKQHDNDAEKTSLYRHMVKSMPELEKKIAELEAITK